MTIILIKKKIKSYFWRMYFIGIMVRLRAQNVHPIYSAFKKTTVQTTLSCAK